MAPADRLRALKDAFCGDGGDWDPAWDDLLDFDPDFFEAYIAFAAVPLRGGALDARARALVQLAVDLAVTRLDAAGIRRQIGRALDAGATRAELREVMQIVAGLGILSSVVGVPVLLEEMRKAGRPDAVPAGELDARRAALKAGFESARGYWTPFWEDVLRLDPDFFEAYLNLSSLPWRTQALAPKVKEFIYIAIDAAATLLHEPAIRVHIRNALGHGATAAEIMAVLQIVSALGVHSMTLGLPILVDELHRRGR